MKGVVASGDLASGHFTDFDSGQSFTLLMPCGHVCSRAAPANHESQSLLMILEQLHASYPKYHSWTEEPLQCFSSSTSATTEAGIKTPPPLCRAHAIPPMASHHT